MLLSNRSAAYAGAGNWDEALKDAIATIQAQPDFAKGWSRKGAALAGKAQDVEGALKAYKRCIELDPSNSAAKIEIQRLETLQASSSAAQASRSAAFSTFGARASATGRASSNKAPLVMQLVLMLAQLFALVSTVQFLVASDPAQSRFMYGRVVMGCMFSFVMEALICHGTPGIGTVKNVYKAVRGTATQDDVQGIFNFAMDENTHLVFYCSLLFSTMPGILLLFPIMPIVFVSFGKRTKAVVSNVGVLSSSVTPLCDRIIAKEAQMQQTSANSEILILIIVIFELFTPRRNVFLLILLVQVSSIYLRPD